MQDAIEEGERPPPTGKTKNTIEIADLLTHCRRKKGHTQNTDRAQPHQQIPNRNGE